MNVYTIEIRGHPRIEIVASTINQAMYELKQHESGTFRDFVYFEVLRYRRNNEIGWLLYKNKYDAINDTDNTLAIGFISVREGSISRVGSCTVMDDSV